MASAKTLIGRLKGEPAVMASVVKVDHPDGGHAFVLVSRDPGDACTALIFLGSGLAQWADGHPGELPAELVEIARLLQRYEDGARARGGQGPIPFTVPDDG